MADKSDDNQSLVSVSSASSGKENPNSVGQRSMNQTLSHEEQQDQEVQERYNTGKDLNITSQPECVPAMEVLKASVLLILSSLGVQASSLSIDHLTYITTKYIDRLVSELHRSTEIQRRRTIAKRDVQLVVDRGILDLEDVTSEYERLKLTRKRVKPSIEKLSKYASELKESTSSVQVSENDKDAFFFFDIAEKISEFMPLRMKRKNYIPKWMPVLPPEHTYVATPQFTEVISDPKELREQLTAESRLGEKALQHLIGTKIVEDKKEDVGNENDNDIDKENHHGEIDVESDHNLEKGPNEETNGVQPQPLKSMVSSKRFDIVAYAKHRMLILEKRRRHQEQLLENRRKEIDGLVGQYLGYYATKKIEPPVSDIIVNIMNTEYYHVSREISKSEHRKQKIQESQQLKRRKLEDELQQELEHQTEDIDFEFNFDEDDVNMNKNLNENPNENENDDEQVLIEEDTSFDITNGDTEKTNQETPFTNGSSKQWDSNNAILDSTNSEPEPEPPMADLFYVDTS
ncbi:hypothetical protein LJB42_003754 [Komagataella kurtzmanii]|nr:hypothetical protein LJB42_003754 [Komagataella kurtzmanii]